MNHIRMLSIGIVAIFLGASLLAFITPSTFNQLGIQSSTLNNTQTYVSETHTAVTFGNSWQDSISTSLNLQVQPNGAGQWYNGTTSAYVISVPSDSNANFIQSIQPSVTVKSVNTRYATNFFGSNVAWSQIDAQNSITYTEKVIYTPYSFTGNYYGSSFQVGNTFTSSVQSINTPNSGTLGSQSPFDFPSYQANENATNFFNSQTGILEFEISANATFFQGSVSGDTQTLNMFAEIYIVPGTGTLNPPTNVQLGNSVMIKGTISYGDYSLLITSPTGTQTTKNIGQFTTLGKSFGISYTPVQLGKYKVELYNSVVGLTETQFFSASTLLPTPQVLINTASSSSGYYVQGQEISYTVDMSYNQSLPIQFELYIWVGAENSQPTSGSGNYLTDGTLHSAKDINGNYQFNGSFIIPANGKAAGAITVEAYAYYSNASSLLVSKNPGVTQIQVGASTHHVTPTSGFMLGKFLVALSVIIIGGVAAYFDPDTINMRVLVFVSSLVFALVYYGGTLL